MFNDTVTVYNKYKDADGTEKWRRTVLKGVFWNAIKGSVTRRTGVASADGVQLIIPTTVKASRAAYNRPKEWTGLADKSGFWTLQSGDTIIKGDMAIEVVRSTKELQGYDDILVVTSVDTKDFGGGMSHWEVSGK
jgi:hypothetical protein